MMENLFHATTSTCNFKSHAVNLNFKVSIEVEREEEGLNNKRVDLDSSYPKKI